MSELTGREAATIHRLLGAGMGESDTHVFEQDETNPLNDDDLAEFVKLQKTYADSPKSWRVDANNIDKRTIMTLFFIFIAITFLSSK